MKLYQELAEKVQQYYELDSCPTPNIRGESVNDLKIGVRNYISELCQKIHGSGIKNCDVDILGSTRNFLQITGEITFRFDVNEETAYFMVMVEPDLIRCINVSMVDTLKHECGSYFLDNIIKSTIYKCLMKEVNDE